MTPDEFASLFTKIQLTAKVRSRLERICIQPEGDVEARWVHRLITDYFFSPQQIDCNVPAGAGRAAASSNVSADIVVYRDRALSEPFIVIEVKKVDTPEYKGIKQAESYSRNLGADYHVWSDWIVTKYFKTAKYVDQSTPVGNIPTWAAGQRGHEYLSKSHILPPFKDEEHLRKVVKNCHDKIFFNLGHDPAKSFDELMKLLFVKMYDERVTPRVYRFARLPDQTKADTAQNVRNLFSEAAKSARYSDVFTTRFSKPGENVFLDLDDETIVFVVEQFQSFSLINTTSTLEGIDIKGTVFEKMVGSTFRGELGAYFTPRELVEFCIRMVAPKPSDRVLDPSCGSGGFLIMVIKEIASQILADNPNLSEAELLSAIRDFSERNVFGVDINERMVRVAKMNMIMHGDGHSGIYNSHGLNLGHSDRLPIKNASVDKILSNPPFAGREADPSHLARFETAKADDGSLVSLHKAIPFVEMIIRLLKAGGVAALVLPNGIFNSPSRTFRKLRQIIYRDTKILAVVALPHWVFFHTGCDVQGSLLFIKKEQPPQDYDIFMDWADNVGYDAKGSKTTLNDLPKIADRYCSPHEDNLFKFSKMKANDRFDPLFYRPGSHEKFFESNAQHTLQDLVEPSGTPVSKTKKNHAKYLYLEVGGADPITGEILKLEEYRASDLPSRAKWIVRENMILFPNHRNSIAAKRAPVLVSQEHDGIVATSRFIPLHCKVAPQYVYHILNSDIIKEKLLQTVTGGSSTEIKWDVIKDLAIPLPASDQIDTFLADVIEIQSKMENADRQVRSLRSELASKFAELFEA